MNINHANTTSTKKNNPSSKPIRIILLVAVVLLIAWLSIQGLALINQFLAGRIVAQSIDAIDPGSKNSFTCRQIPESDQAGRAIIDRAVGYLKRSVRLSPRMSQPHLLLGRVYCLLGNKEEALAQYEVYTRMRPRNPLGYLESGFAQETTGDIQAAIENWRAGNATTEQFLSSGDQNRTVGNFSEAINWYRRATLMGSDLGIVYESYTQGLSAESLGEWDKAIASYQDTLENDRKTNTLASSAYYHIGLINQDQFKDWNEALANYDRAVLLGGFLTDLDRSDTHFRKGVILKYGIKDFEQAMQEFQLSLESYPYKYGALLELGDSYWTLEHNFELAEATLKTATSSNPGAIWAYLILGGIYREQKMYDKSLEQYKIALQIDPSNADIQKSIQEISDIISTP